MRPTWVTLRLRRRLMLAYHARRACHRKLDLSTCAHYTYEHWEGLYFQNLLPSWDDAASQRARHICAGKSANAIHLVALLTGDESLLRLPAPSTVVALLAGEESLLRLPAPSPVLENALLKRKTPQPAEAVVPSLRCNLTFSERAWRLANVPKSAKPPPHRTTNSRRPSSTACVVTCSLRVPNL